MQSTAQPAVPPLLAERPGLLVCPRCAAPLGAASGCLVCSGCGKRHACDGGIPALYLAGDEEAVDGVTEAVRAFYDAAPFPGYEDLDSAASLVAKARRGLFARRLDEELPADASVLDAGCGTGQLSNFLALAPCRTVVGADVCRRSLELAQGFKVAQGIDNATFVEMSLLRPAVAREAFDLVVSNGVLHHTAAPEAGFRSLVELVRPGGYLLVGLYNFWGRLPTRLRGIVLRRSGPRLGWLDPRLRRSTLGAARRRAWFRDQYMHPHESSHTIGEVLAWFAAAGLEFVNSIPPPRALDAAASEGPLFLRRAPAGASERALAQLAMLLAGGREGGLFLMIGRKQGGGR